MSIDDKVADLQTINRLKEKLAALGAIKDMLLSSNKELDTEITSLKAHIKDLENERECLIAELNDLRAQLDKYLK